MRVEEQGERERERRSDRERERQKDAVRLCEAHTAQVKQKKSREKIENQSYICSR